MQSKRVRNIFPSEERSRHEERENAVNIVLQDMQRFLPAPMEPMALAAVRDYMVTTLTRLEQPRHFDTLMIRNASMEILIRDGTTRLINLITHARTLLAALTEVAPANGAALREYNFSVESFHRNLTHLNALEARLVVCDVEYMALRSQKDKLQRESEQTRGVLQRRAAEREEARKTLQEREEELKRTKHILERVEAERDISRRTADYVTHQLHDLQRRLEEAERVSQGPNRTVGLPLNSLSQRDHAAAARALPAPGGAETALTAAHTAPWMAPQQDRGPRQDDRDSSRLRYAELIARLAVEESKRVESTTEEQAQVEGGDAPVKTPATPQRTIPCLPLMPPTPSMTPIARASAVRKQREDAAEISTQATVSSFLALVEDTIN